MDVASNIKTLKKLSGKRGTCVFIIPFVNLLDIMLKLGYSPQYSGDVETLHMHIKKTDRRVLTALASR